MGIPSSVGAILVLLPAVFAGITKTHSAQFQKWYPEYNHIYERILRDNCSEEYAFYLAGQPNGTRYFGIDRWSGATATSQVVFPAASCVLNHTSEWMKFNMASAAVMLGLTPAILASLGPSIEETSTLLVIARRHVLGVCLAAGSPSIYPFRSINYKETIEDIVNGNSETRIHPARLPRFAHYIISVLEYLLAGLAIVNNATNSYQLGMQVSCSFAPHIYFLPLMWAFLGVLVAHVYGSWALWARIHTGRPYKTPWQWYRWVRHEYTWSRLPQSVWRWVECQFKPSVFLPKPQPEILGESFLSIVAAWWVSLNIACHIIFGTLTFSSLLFISVRDAVTVIGRYLASLLLCRAILTYELACLRDRPSQLDSSRPESGMELLERERS